MSLNKFIDKIHEIISLIREFIETTKLIISFIEPRVIGKVADNINQIHLYEQEINKKTLINQISVFKKIINIINESVNLITAENIIKDALIGRSFTYIADLKKLRDSILSLNTEILNLYNDLLNEYAQKIPINTEQEKNLVRDEPEILIRLSNILNDPKSKASLDKLIDNIFNLDVTLLASIILRTWPREEEIINANVPTVVIKTGQNINYNLQGYTSANWVNKHKLGESKNSGLSKLVIKRCATIVQGPPSPIEFKINDTLPLSINYGGDTYKLSYIPNLPVRQIKYGIILAEEAAKKIILNPPEEEFDRKRDEAFKNDMMSRIKSILSAELREFLRTKKPFKSIKDLIKELMKLCALAIKKSLIISEKDINKLLINMAAITESYKRVDSELIHNLDERFGKITIEELDKKHDYSEIINDLCMKSIEVLLRQPSIFDLL